MGVTSEGEEPIFVIRNHGIDLPSAQRIIEAHGGTIRAESEGRGKGTPFQFTLPVAGPVPTDSHNNR